MKKQKEKNPDIPSASWIRRFHDSDYWLWAEVAVVVTGLAFVIPTGITLMHDLEDRQSSRIAQAWESVTRSAPGNSGKGPALEYLNSQNVPLVGINLSTESNESRSYLVGVDLSGANLADSDLAGATLFKSKLLKTNLTGSNLSGVNLASSDLTGAFLNEANLSESDLTSVNMSDAAIIGANFSGVDLKGAKLVRATLWDVNFTKASLWSADLSGADLSGADFTGASLSSTNLKNANLSAANLISAEDLSQKYLDVACGDKKTKLPKGFSIKACVK